MKTKTHGVSNKSFTMINVLSKNSKAEKVKMILTGFEKSRLKVSAIYLLYIHLSGTPCLLPSLLPSLYSITTASVTLFGFQCSQEYWIPHHVPWFNFCDPSITIGFSSNVTFQRWLALGYTSTLSRTTFHPLNHLQHSVLPFLQFNLLHSCAVIVVAPVNRSRGFHFLELFGFYEV